MTIVPLDRIITYMHYYYILAHKGSHVYRHYAQLDPASADILHDVLLDRYDFVQVCEVPRSGVESDLLL